MAATVPQLRTILISECQELACTVAAIHSQLHTVYYHTTDKAHNMHVSEPVQTLSISRNQYENQPWHDETYTLTSCVQNDVSVHIEINVFRMVSG